jgi:hypothetical protein
MEGTDVTALAPAPERATRVPARSFGRLAAVSDVAVFAGLAIWIAALAALTWGTWGDLTMDTGYDLLAGSRVAHGELPYIDYQYYYGPVGALLLGGVFALAGTTVGSAIAVGFVLAVAIVVLTYGLGKRLDSPAGGALAAALTATTALSSANNSFVVPHTIAAPLAVAASLAAATGIAAFASGGARRWLVFAGAMAGVAALAHVQFAGAAAVAMTAWAAVHVARARHDRRKALGDAAALAAAAIALPLLVYAAFAARVGPGELLWENLWPRDMLREAGSVVLRGMAPLTAGSFAEVAARLVVYAAGTAGLLVAAVAIGRGGRTRRLALLALAGAALGFLAVLAARPDTVRFYLKFGYGWIPAGAGIALLGLLWHARRSRTWTPDRQVALFVVAWLAVVALSAYAGFRPHPNAKAPSSAAYAMPFVALFLVWLHAALLPRGSRHARAVGLGWVVALVLANAVLVVVDARDDTVTVRGPGGALAAAPEDGPALQAVVDEIGRSTRPGEPVLIAPQLTALYTIADRRDPLRQLSLLPGALPDAEAEGRAIARMDDVRLAVLDTTPLDLYQHGRFGSTFGQGVVAWIQRDFTLVRTVRGRGSDARAIELWMRRSG